MRSYPRQQLKTQHLQRLAEPARACCMPEIPTLLEASYKLVWAAKLDQLSPDTAPARQHLPCSYQVLPPAGLDNDA